MREIVETKTVQEIVGYEAEDGSYFKSREECEKYEKSAEMVAFRAAEEYRFTETYVDNISGCIPCWCACHVTLYDVKDERAMLILNNFFSIRYGEDARMIKSEFVGKKIFVLFDYDPGSMDILGDREEILDSVKNAIDKVLNKD